MTTHALSRPEFELPLSARAELPAGRSLESMRLGSLHGRSILPSTPDEQRKPSSLPYVAGLFLVVAVVAGLAGYTGIVEVRGIDLAAIGLSGALSAAGVAGLARIVCVASAALFVITVAADLIRRR
jgi:uncharacterized membrane protein YtjA (UPF0391 family)